jgi:flagellar protein FliO/FliZ
MMLRRVPCLLLLGMSSTCARATESLPQTSGLAAFMQALFGLVVVLGLLYGFFWLLRRYGPGQAAAQGVVKVVGGVMLGPRERIVVVEVQDTWLLVGVAAGQVNTLHTMPRPDGVETLAQPAPLPFADKLAELIKRPRD